MQDREHIEPGLCGDCTWARWVRSARAAYLRCGRSDEDARYPRYPPLPVLHCEGQHPPTDAEEGLALGAGESRSNE